MIKIDIPISSTRAVYRVYVGYNRYELEFHPYYFRAPAPARSSLIGFVTRLSKNSYRYEVKVQSFERRYGKASSITEAVTRLYAVHTHKKRWFK